MDMLLTHQNQIQIARTSRVPPQNLLQHFLLRLSKTGEVEQKALAICVCLFISKEQHHYQMTPHRRLLYFSPQVALKVKKEAMFEYISCTYKGDVPLRCCKNLTRWSNPPLDLFSLFVMSYDVSIRKGLERRIRAKRK